MSIDVMSAVWKLKDLADSEMLILLAMADWADKEGICWPSIAQLADKTNKSERTIQGAIKAIVSKGHLTRVENPGKGCKYIVHPRSGCAPAETAPPQRATETPAAAAPNTLDTPVTQKTSSSSKARARKAPAFVLPADIPMDEWRDYEEMRRSIRKPMTQSIRAKAITRLRKLRDEDGWPPGDVLNHSTLNSYQGLFPPPRENRHGKSSRSDNGFFNACVDMGRGRTG
jgi:hypothetical protein